LERALMENSKEIWEMVQDPKTFVYIAGLMPAAQTFEHAMAVTAGSAEAWRGTHAQLVTEGRLSELLYE
jgi:ferredoxin--NADP+ reductase